MSPALRALLLGLGITLALYLLALLALVLAGRRADARALARFLPDCVVLLRRVLGEPRVPRLHKLALAAALAYLAFPLDLVPDVLPVAGQLDDVLVVALALRLLARGAGSHLIAELWPGPPASLRAVLRLAGARTS